MPVIKAKKCVKCHGTGRVGNGAKCKVCKGTGEIVVAKSRLRTHSVPLSYDLAR